MTQGREVLVAWEVYGDSISYGASRVLNNAAPGPRPAAPGPVPRPAR